MTCFKFYFTYFIYKQTAHDLNGSNITNLSILTKTNVVTSHCILDLLEELILQHVLVENKLLAFSFEYSLVEFCKYKYLLVF